MNSTVRPIFNESFVEKKRFMGPMNSARDPLVTQKRTSPKKKRRHKADKLNPNTYLGSIWIPLILLKTKNTVAK